MSTDGATIMSWLSRGSAERSLAAPHEGVGLSLLVARQGDLPEAAVARALTEAGAADVRTNEIGSHAEHFEASTR